MLASKLRRLDPGGADRSLHPLPRSACRTIRALRWGQCAHALLAMLGDVSLGRAGGSILAQARRGVERSGADRVDHVVGRVLGKVADTVRGAITIAAVALATSRDHLDRPLVVVAPPCLDLGHPRAQLLDTPLSRGVKLLEAFGRLLEATGDLGSLALAPEVAPGRGRTRARPRCVPRPLFSSQRQRQTRRSAPGPVGPLAATAPPARSPYRRERRAALGPGERARC